MVLLHPQWLHSYSPGPTISTRCTDFVQFIDIDVTLPDHSPAPIPSDVVDLTYDAPVGFSSADPVVAHVV